VERAASPEERDSAGSQTPGEMTETERQTKIEEYKGAQASAEHLDSISWTIKGALWAGNLALLGFAIGQLANAANLITSTRGILTGAAWIGISALVAAYLWSRQCGKAITFKLHLCQQLEKPLGMTQHTDAPWTEGLGGQLTCWTTCTLTHAWIAVVILAWVL
jgi:hypothetical protein